MTLVIITGSGPEHRFVANTICATHDVSAILVCDPPARRRWRSVLNASLTQFVDKSLRSLYLRAIGDASMRKQSLFRVLGPMAREFDRQDLVRNVGRPKDGTLLAEVAQLAPDILAVYGTGIIPDPVLAKANVALNLHTGLSPQYRGVACTMWPLIDGLPEMIGATVHECVRDVDGGRVFARRAAHLRRGDDSVHDVFGRAVATGGALYCDVIGDAIGGRLEGTPQDLNCGREFRGAEIGIRSELAARRALRKLSPSFPLSV